MRNYRAPGSIDRLNDAAEFPSRLWNSGSGLKAELSTETCAWAAWGISTA